MSKPKVDYAQFAKTLMRYEPYSLANIIERVKRDVAANPKMRQLLPRERDHLRFMQEQKIASKNVFELNDSDVIEHCKGRANDSLNPVGRATVKHDVRIITKALKYAKSTWADCKKIKLDCIEDALPYLQRNELIGKGGARERVASVAEEMQARAFFQAENDRGENKYKAMPDLIEFACISARRRGEIVRITWGDIDFEQQIYWVRDMKHPTKKKGNDKFFILWPELAAIILRQPRVDPNDPTECVFPYNGNVVGQKFSAAMAKMGIVDLHFHDLRATAITRWRQGKAVPSQPDPMPIEDIRICISGHDSTKILESVYDRTTSNDLKAKYLSPAPRLEQVVAPQTQELVAA